MLPMRPPAPSARSGLGRLQGPCALTLLAALLALGCATGPVTPAGARPATGTGAPERAAQEARDADLGMNAAVAARDPAAFARHVASEAIFFGDSGPAPGRAAVVTAWAPFFAAEGPRLTWAPDRAEASSSGDLVFTWGAWTFQPRSGDAERGRYLTAWRRDADGTLRAILDGDATPLPALPAGLTWRILKSVASADGQLLAEGGLLHDDGREVGHFLRFSRLEKGSLVQVSEGGRYRPDAP
jgi:ketosteroid isomerase-like protein